MTEYEKSKLSRLLKTLKQRSGFASHESTSEGISDDVPLDGDAALARISSALARIPGDEIGDPVAFAKAKDLLLQHSATTLKRAERDDFPILFDDNDLGNLEAIVTVDGSRPSLMLRGGKIFPDHPFLGNWRNDVLGLSTAITRCAASVGRIEPNNGSSSKNFGTGFVFDLELGLVMTAGHVLRDIKKHLGRAVAEKNGVSGFSDDVAIDFNAEISSESKRRLKVVAGTPVGQGGFDAAVLKIRPFIQGEAGLGHEKISEIPAGLDLRPERPSKGRLISGTFCLIGFPGLVPPPGWRGEAEDRVDWSWVTYQLMGGQHGVKRLAPGIVLRQPGTILELEQKRRFEHDATSLNGNSGSPIIAWRDSDEPVFGMHISGTTLVGNYAEWLPEMKADLDRAVDLMRIWRE